MIIIHSFVFTCFLSSSVISFDGFHEDGTVRPQKNSKYCAATKTLEPGSVLKWIDCKKLFQSDEFYGNFSAVRPDKSYGYQNLIQSNDRNDTCWTMRSPKSKGFKSKYSFVTLDSCDESSFSESQLFYFTKQSLILLANSTSASAYFIDNWKAYVGIPFLGADEALRSRLMYNIEIDEQNELLTFWVLESWAESVVTKNLYKVSNLYDDNFNVIH